MHSKIVLDNSLCRVYFKITGTVHRESINRKERTTMKITVKGNSNERLKVTSDERREDVEPVLREIRKMSRKLRHLLKNGYEIDLTISSENSPLEE